jgi:hypothetical protein
MQPSQQQHKNKVKGFRVLWEDRVYGLRGADVDRISNQLAVPVL